MAGQHLTIPTPPEVLSIPVETADRIIATSLELQHRRFKEHFDLLAMRVFELDIGRSGQAFYRTSVNREWDALFARWDGAGTSDDSRGVLRLIFNQMRSDVETGERSVEVRDYHMDSQAGRVALRVSEIETIHNLDDSTSWAVTGSTGPFIKNEYGEVTMVTGTDYEQRMANPLYTHSISTVRQLIADLIPMTQSQREPIQTILPTVFIH